MEIKIQPEVKESGTSDFYPLKFTNKIQFQQTELKPIINKIKWTINKNKKSL